VKTPKSVSSEQMNRMNALEREQEQVNQRESLRDELKIMSFLSGHPNVVQLLGAITTNKDDFCVVIEYCEYGGMDSFLRGKFDNNKFINELIPQTDSEGYLLNKHSRSQTVRLFAFCANEYR
jgi:serine/threonine protein kinase